MNSDDILRLFGKTANSQELLSLYSALNTLRRPSLSFDEPHIFHDWMLVRQQGIELGFVDSAYHLGERRFFWGHGELLLTQAYFYSSHADISNFLGNLPYGLTFSDTREKARNKMDQFEEMRRSYINDTWEIGGVTLSITYCLGYQGIDRIACRIPALPLERRWTGAPPVLTEIIGTFGESLESTQFSRLWGEAIDQEQRKNILEDGIVELSDSIGVTLSMERNENQYIFRSIVMHRSRDEESVEWNGALPFGLDFNDSPEILFKKINSEISQQSDSALTGHAVWHFPDYTMHVLYSNFDNFLLRVKLIAPGCWQCMDEI